MAQCVADPPAPGPTHFNIIPHQLPFALSHCRATQKDALHLAAKALDVFDVTDNIDIACFIKKEFDKLYGPGWQCIVGTDFGSFVTHCHGCFIYFCIGSLAILLFKGTAGPEAETSQFAALEPVKA